MMSSGFFFSSRRRHTRWPRDWSSDVCSSDLIQPDSEAWLPTEEVVRLYRQRMQIEQCFRDWKSHLGLRGLHLQVQKSERLLRSEERRVGKECRARWWWYE